ncbi:MAG: hypothetical protein WD010_00305 [Nitriliruptor sp.]|uniref:hypothetical protein n=1 Tax=Nitriliruptor sp. TaxID=2448056 RepID=UPI0034A07A3D
MSLGLDGSLLVLSLEPRGPRLDDHALEPGPVVDADVLVEGLDRARRAAGLDAAGTAVVAADPDVARDLRARGFGVVAPVESTVTGTLSFAHGDGFSHAVEELEPDLTSVRVRWNPGDDADVKKEQALGLTRLAAWLHETDRKLLVEVVVPPLPADLDQVGRDHDRFVSELRPGLSVEAVREIRELGTEADLWAVEHGASSADLDALVTEAGRDEVGVLVIVASPDQPLDPPAGHVRGMLVDRPVWRAALAGATGARGVDADAVAAALSRFIEFHAARRSS